MFVFTGNVDCCHGFPLALMNINLPLFQWACFKNTIFPRRFTTYLRLFETKTFLNCHIS